MKGGRGSAYKTESSSGYKNLSLSHAEEVLILNPDTKWECQLHVLVTLPPAENPGTN